MKPRRATLRLIAPSGRMAFSMSTTLDAAADFIGCDATAIAEAFNGGTRFTTPAQRHTHLMIDGDEYWELYEDTFDPTTGTGSVLPEYAIRRDDETPQEYAARNRRIMKRLKAATA